MRLAELMGTFSLATDAGMGSPADHGLRSATLAARLAELAGADERVRAQAYYLTLLRYVGCTAGVHSVADVLSDELAFGTNRPTIDYGRSSEMMIAIVADAYRTAGLAGVGRALAALPEMAEVGREHCETAVILARRLDFDDVFLAALNMGFERWDGSGQPTRARKDAISLPMRITQVAIDIDRAFELDSTDAAVACVKKHGGRELDPDLVALFLAHVPELSALREAPSAWSSAMDAEPAPVRLVDDALADQALSAMADFADMKSTFTRGHSRGVAARALAGAKRLRLGEALERQVYRAGLVHDIGRVAVGIRVWDKPGPLTDTEWERVRIHTYAGERILSRAPGLADIAAIATAAHERLDGSGYHRKLGQAGLPMAARLLAAADVYQALLEPRAHRSARPVGEAATELRRLAVSGTLASDAVEAVLGAAGHVERPAGPAHHLTPRELEVLGLVGQGLTNKEIAQRLDISTKTAGRHVEHIFDKLEVTTRAGATMVALQRGLIGV